MLSNSLNKPIISIIIPVYNRATLIVETLESIKTQTYTNIECIIIDDHSSDNTFKVVKDYCKRDARFRIVKRPAEIVKGPGGCRNYGFSISSGSYINWCDSDDILQPFKLQQDLEILKGTDFDFTISQSKFFGESDDGEFWNANLYSSDPIDDFITKHIGWSINAPLWKRTSIEKIGLSFDEDLITADDYDYHIEALVNNLTPIVYNTVTVKLRVHDNRLENYKVKSPFKLKVYHKILSNNSLDLNSITNIHLSTLYLKQLSNLLKNKKLLLGFKNCYKFMVVNVKFKFKIKALKLLFYGCVYRLTSRGFKYLNA